MNTNIDATKIRERRQYLASLLKEHSVSEANTLFRKRFKSNPTPQEFKWAGVNLESTQHTYAITDGEYVKIGISSHVPSRLSTLRTANARKLRVALVMPYGGAELERQLHGLYSKYRAQGEWFKITDEIKKDLEEMALINYETYGQVFSECATVTAL